MRPPADSPPRRMRGFEPAAGLLRARIRQAGEARGFAVARLLTHWAEVVGEETARLCKPLKVGYGREGFGATLTLIVQGAAAPLVQMSLPQIQDRVNACYGYNAIARITVTQTGAGAVFTPGMAESQAGYTPPAPQPDPKTQAASASLAEGVQDPALRDALALLGQNILSKRHK